jgi:hypothetical protein
MSERTNGWWGARVVALVLLAVTASLAWRTGHEAAQADRRPIWIEPGEYHGPADTVLDQAQVEAIAERAKRLTF